MKKTISVVLALVLCVGIMSGCGASFDPSAFIKGGLDANYLGVFSDEYTNMIVDGDKDELAEDYEESMEGAAEAFAAYFEIDLDACGDEVRAELTQLVKDIYAKSKYEIGDSTKSGDKYLVDVTVYPMDILTKIVDEDYEDFYNDIADRDEAGEFNEMSDEEFELVWANGIMDLLKARLATVDYLDPVTVSVQIVADEEDGLYTMSDTDFQHVDELMIAIP